MPAAISPKDIDLLDAVSSGRHKVKRGEALYTSGATFRGFYAVRTGFFKTCISTEDGRSQVTGFQMLGDTLGWDGVATQQHICDAIALEDAEACLLPFEKIEEISRQLPVLQTYMLKIMGNEIVREHNQMLLLGNMKAEERLASFLLNLAQRMQARGFSASELVLRMTREEIGSYLGLKLETVSRTFSKFAAEGILEVKQRHVRLLRTDALQAIVHMTQAAHTCGSNHG